MVIDPDHAGVGILTERDVLDSMGAGQDPDAELAAHHCTSDLVFAAPAWTLEKAAAAMVRGGFRHLVVIDGHEVTGLLSMRDIVRCWSGSPVPAPGQAAASERTQSGQEVAAAVPASPDRRMNPAESGRTHASAVTWPAVAVRTICSRRDGNSPRLRKRNRPRFRCWYWPVPGTFGLFPTAVRPK